jgi:hypothetical protein
MRTRAILAFLAFATLGCRTSMNKRPDASPGPETGIADAAVDARNAPDVARPDLPTADTLVATGMPKAFRVVNRSDRTVYVKSKYDLGCDVHDFSGSMPCTYFRSCSPLCSQVQDVQTCCVECEQDLTLYPIPAGQSLLMFWDGTFFVKQTSPCTDCQCDLPRTGISATFEVTARIYTSYSCMPSGCKTIPDGMLDLAMPTGAFRTATTRFSVPSADEEVVLIAELPDQDASTTDAPAKEAPADATSALDARRDWGADTSKTLLSEVSGRSFQIATSEALPDAGIDGRSCATSHPGAVYRLTFSDDGAKVTVVRTDPVQEPDLTGTLTKSSSNLVYDLKPAFAGASLLVRRDGGNLIGELVMNGSGFPVIWCIESPMRPM